jgi:hypothetical protein
MAQPTAQVRQYAESIELWSTASGEAFWCPPLGRIIGEIRQGQFRYRDPLGLRIFQAWQALPLACSLPSPPRFPSERAFREACCQELSARGWQTQTEVVTMGGRIDLVATHRETTAVMLVEVKLGADSHTMAHVLGQLLFSQPSFPSASLWVACPQRPTDRVLAMLAMYHVQYLEGPWTIPGRDV